METNKLYCGDNLEIMRSIPPDVIDLIYADPPFFTNRDFVDFDDRFEDIYAYIDWMVPRLKEMHRLLKSTGSIYLHVDWHASAYLKIEMDRIFGMQNFRNEIVWCYGGGGTSKKDFGKKHDTILRYSKTENYTFNVDSVRMEYGKDSKNQTYHPDKNKKSLSGVYEYKMNPKGKHPVDWWTDVKKPYGPSKELLGYPTQKPEALLERVIKASSNPGDIVFDPFCGCGTAPAGAKKLGRKYIGIDINPDAIDLTRQRLAQIITYGSINERWVKRAQPAVTVNVGQTNQNTVNIR